MRSRFTTHLLLLLLVGCASPGASPCAVESYSPTQPVWWLDCLEPLEDPDG